MHSCVAVFVRCTAQSPVDDRPESRAPHGLAGGASPTVLERGAGYVETVLLLSQLDQFAVDDLPAAGLPPPGTKRPISASENPISRKKSDDTYVPDR